jgi:hypothetical protein
MRPGFYSRRDRLPGRNKRVILGALVLLASTLHAGPERPLTPAVADASPYSQRLLDVATGEETALLVWQDFPRVLGLRVGRDGRQVDEQPFVIQDNPAAGWGTPIVIRGAGNWLVAWKEGEALTGRLVSDDGTIGGRRELGTGFHQSVDWLRGAFDGRTFLIAHGNSSAISAVRVSMDGNRIGERFVIGQSLGYSALDVAAFAGGGFAVTYAQRQMSSEETHILETLRYDASGARA